MSAIFNLIMASKPTRKPVRTSVAKVTGVVSLASGMLLGACSAIGIRNVEEPSFRNLGQVGAVEIRSYGARLAAETVVPGDEIDARSAGFRKLAAYIFGANRSTARIAMTAPASQASETIAMTAPVDIAPASAGEWRVRFFMPAHYTPSSLPQPLDPAIRIVTVPGEAVGVLRYSGSPSPKASRAASDCLLRALAGSQWRAHGTPSAWFYDPPWTIPQLRRNEAAVPVTPRSGGG